MEDKRFCVICLSDRTSEKYWRHNTSGQRVCLKCYLKFVYVNRKQQVKKQNDTRNPRKIRFKNRRIVLKENPRKGLCLDCGRLGRTEMHHRFYLIIMPWACTVEICASCHMKESWRTGRFTKNKES